MGNRLNREGNSEQSEPECMEEVGIKVSDCLTQLYAPSPPQSMEMDIIFFHGLQLDFKSDSHLSTWRIGDESGELWPMSWLPSEYPKARILVASYDACIQTTATTGRQDLHSISEALFHDLLIVRDTQGRNCPVILVGHSFGGLVIKQLCIIAHAKKDDDPFIQRVRGIFFYATPHRGMNQEFLSERGMGRSSARRDPEADPLGEKSAVGATPNQPGNSKGDDPQATNPIGDGNAGPDRATGTRVTASASTEPGSPPRYQVHPACKQQ
ncbi:hypothetical protein R1sor_003160 [Riccia sorocarpa]|uniref:GPI inositol-deacylase n=1 Tax=Riccia sorocarpa TaxID=122646 RepID=A0ABD3H174_9MARC